MLHGAVESLVLGPDFTGLLSNSSPLQPFPYRQPWKSRGKGRQERRGEKVKDEKVYVERTDVKKMVMRLPIVFTGISS